MRISVPDDEWPDRLRDLGAEVVVWDLASPQPDGHLDLVLAPYSLDPGPLSRLDPSRIGVVQLQSLGFDGVAEAVQPGAVVANAIGVHEGATAELAMALILAATRRIDRFVRDQTERMWRKEWAAGLIDQTVLLVGVGGIGGDLLARLNGFGASVVRVGSRARDDDHGHVHGPDELSDLLPTADVVVLAVPLTDETMGLVDDAFVAAMPDGALLVNVSRGKVVDTDAIVRAAGRISFASDVFDPEPLPPDHPLWSTPNVLVTPHVGGRSSSMRTRVEALVRHQVTRIAVGEGPDHVVIRS